MQFLEIDGEFTCKECDAVVRVARFYRDSKAIEWMCSKYHRTRVSLFVKRGY